MLGEKLGKYGQTLFSDCRTWRYTLWRGLTVYDGVSIAFIGVNPSKADENRSDPTVTRCRNRAKSLGADQFCMLNLFGYRSTDIRGLRETPDPVGPGNDEALAVVVASVDLVVMAWGASGKFKGIRDRAEWVMGLPTKSGEPLRTAGYCLGQNKDGTPKHPLMIANAQQLVKLK